jgi:hypothetical protein
MIMKRNYILFLCCILTGFSGCKKFVDVNQNPNSPTDVSEALILAPVEVSISSSLFAGNVSNIVLQYMQVMALNQNYPNTGTYLMYNVDVNPDWITIYTTELNNLTALTSKATANGNYKYSGISKILTAFTLGTATDLWGDIPYSESFLGITNLRPKYDAQKDIYNNIQALLDGAIADIAKNTGKAPGADDLYYAGDMSKWTKLAYTLKARYYMHLTKAPGHTAAEQSQLALTALTNGMASRDDDLKMTYTGSAGTENPWQQDFISSSTIVLSSTFVNGFALRNDPRLTKMVAPATETGLYTGRVIGTEGIGSLESYSRPSDYYAGAAAFTYLVTYEEALFLKAEATFRISGAAAAAPVYQSAVTTHMNRLGINPTASATYLASRSLTASNALQLIIEEKGIANFLSMETWVDWRRTGYPPLTKVLNALSDIPRRILYPQVEQVANPQAIQSAKLTDRLWWDAVQ